MKKGQLLAVIASEQLSEQRSELAAAEQRLRLARILFERERTLWQERISAEQDYLQAQQSLRVAEIDLRNAQEKTRALGGGSDAGVRGRPLPLHARQHQPHDDGRLHQRGAAEV